MPFEFRARYGLLTYAQCGDLDPHAVCEHLGRLGAECIIGREDHEDGGVHLHAFCMWEGEYRTRSQRQFDVDGCHPNIVRGYGTPEKGYDYAIKDGDVVAGGLERPSGVRVSASRDPWPDIILSESREQFFEAVSQLAPRSLCTSFTSLRAYADWKYRESPEPYRTPEGVLFREDLPWQLSDWVQQNLGGLGHTGKCLLPVIPVIRTAPLGHGASSPGGGLVLSPALEGAGIQRIAWGLGANLYC